MKRYSRQTILPEIGIEGQKVLVNSKVLIVGVGGLGSPAALYLASAGIGTLGLIDPDCVDESNLQRQILYSTKEQGAPKVLAARQRLLELNPYIQVNTYEEKLDYKNCKKIISEYDLILDGTDHFQTKYLINDLCAKLDKLWIYGSITGFHGMFAAFQPNRGPCLRCYQQSPPKNYVPNCQESGVLGPAVGVIGSMQAALAIKALLFRTSIKPNLNPQYGKMFVFDMGAMNFMSVAIKQRPSCSACIEHRVDDELKYEVQNCAVNADRALKLTQYQNYFILDVRESHEFHEGSLPHAVNWPLSQLRLEPNKFKLPTDKDILVCCRSGVRSQTAIEILKPVQSRTYKNLCGGIMESLNGMYTYPQNVLADKEDYLYVNDNSNYRVARFP